MNAYAARTLPTNHSFPLFCFLYCASTLWLNKRRKIRIFNSSYKASKILRFSPYMTFRMDFEFDPLDLIDETKL